VVRRVGTAAALVLAIGLTPGCGDSNSTGTVTSQPDPSGVIKYEITGGLAGIQERLVIQPAGDATIVSRQTPDGQSGTRFSLSASAGAALRKTVGDAHLDTLPKASGPTGCADCFEYSITYGDMTYAADDSSIAGRAKPVIAALNEVIAEHGKDAGAALLAGK
jgi:hypothetical protein